MTEKIFLTWDNQYLDQAIRLYIDVFSKEPWNDETTYEEIHLYFERMLSMNTFEGYIQLSDSGALLAVAIGFIRPWYKGIEYHLDSFYISTDYQNEGIGTAFINGIKKALDQKGVPDIVLNTMKECPAERFYRKNKFDSSDGFITLYGPTSE